MSGGTLEHGSGSSGRLRRPRRVGRRPKLVAQCPQDSTLCLSSRSSGSRVPEIWDWNWQHLATLGSNPPVERRRPILHLRYFDWQAGARLDLDSGPTRSWAAIGMQGLAPYFFNFAPTLYVRDGGRVAGKNRRLVRFVPHSTPDTTTSNRIEFLQSGGSWTGDRNWVLGPRRRPATRISVFAQVRSLHRVHVHRRIRTDRNIFSSGRGANECTRFVFGAW